ncbi:MAG: STM3941 family protein [Mobilitalea sp.]
MGDIIIEEMNYKAFISVFISLILLLAAGIVTGYGMTVHRLSLSVPGTLCVLVMLVFFIISLKDALKVRKLITICTHGIIDHSTGGSVGFIPYDDIKEFLIISVNDKDAIAVIPRNIDKFLSKFTLVKRRQMRRNIGLNLPPVTINVDMAKDMVPVDILTLLQKRLSDYSRL